MAQQKEQWFIIAAGALLVIGAIFALANTFGGLEWAFWVAMGFFIAATLLYATVHIARRQFNKKYKPSESEIIAAEQRAANCDNCPPVAEPATK